ncbi:beta-phosphoglucomutase [Kineothrix alysoides]|uniref:Beta-phosphoglucomutase n=1 Tax=Kineothrix alysoides TaxID=1469948 RepID=A0A4R1QY39_9FIRM|nr:beta-phosphoglucomutase [Kineothrix alysoides]TCL57574.1 beta-phosphoglucomutase [Kineothrix alysoides]
MKYKAVIFDLDGVICHTDAYHYQAWKALADRMDIYFDETINNRLRGVSRMKSLEIILEGNMGAALTDSEKQYLAEEKNNIYKKLLENMGPGDLSNQVRQTLNILRGAGIKLAIGSSSKNAGFILKQIGLGGYFDAISDGNNITRSKPDPEVFLMASEYLNIPKEDCLVVEDAAAGVDAAIAGGMDCAGIGDEMELKLADYHLKNFNDLLGIVLM